MGNDPAKGSAPQGPSEEEANIEHERFGRYRYLPQEDLLEITIDVPEEKEMKLWETAVSAATAGFEHRYADSEFPRAVEFGTCRKFRRR